MTIAKQIYEKLKKAPPSVAQQVLDFLGYLESRHNINPHPAKTLESFAGILKGSSSFEGDPQDLQDSIRDEWSRGQA